MGNAPILDLDALVPARPVIRIRTSENREGKLYELRVRSELSIMEIQRLMRLSEKVEEMKGELTAESMQFLMDSIDELLGIAIAGDYEGELKEALTLEHKVAVVETFTSACLTPTPVKQAKARKASTGAR